MALPTIGTTPIGQVPWDWYKETTLSQYANSPQMMALCQNFFDAVTPTQIIDNFYDQVFNIDTCNSWGLDIWARIVVIDRHLTSSGEFWGFIQQGMQNIEPFNAHGPFFMGNLGTKNYRVSDDVFRRMILAKALANISEGTVPALNRILRIMFYGRGNCYVTDPGDMTMVYTFEFLISDVELAVLTQTKIFQHPIGVTRSFSFLP